jgi:murein tripeptide amidase MpaA
MYRTVGQLDLLTLILAIVFPDTCRRVRLPNDSIRGHPIYAVRLSSGGGSGRRGILIVGGTHSEELMNPDAIVELLFGMALSYVQDSDIVLGNRRWEADEIRLMIDTLNIWTVPCVNPDGRDYVMTEDDLWRKNRRNNPDTECDGVDLNRNYDILWGVIQDPSRTSCSPCHPGYVGSRAFSEPETLNIKHLLDTERIDTFVDVHSYSELVLYPWSHVSTQTTDSTRQFTGLPTATCAPIGQSGYQEYMTRRDELRFQTVAGRIVDAIDRDEQGLRLQSAYREFGVAQDV